MGVVVVVVEVVLLLSSSSCGGGAVSSLWVSLSSLAATTRVFHVNHRQKHPPHVVRAYLAEALACLAEGQSSLRVEGEQAHGDVSKPYSRRLAKPSLLYVCAERLRAVSPNSRVVRCRVHEPHGELVPAAQ